MQYIRVVNLAARPVGMAPCCRASKQADRTNGAKAVGGSKQYPVSSQTDQPSATP